MFGLFVELIIWCNGPKMTAWDSTDIFSSNPIEIVLQCGDHKTTTSITVIEWLNDGIIYAVHDEYNYVSSKWPALFK